MFLFLLLVYSCRTYAVPPSCPERLVVPIERASFPLANLEAASSVFKKRNLVDFINFGKMINAQDEPIRSIVDLKERMDKTVIDPLMPPRNKLGLRMLSKHQVESGQCIRELVANAGDAYVHLSNKKPNTIDISEIPEVVITSKEFALQGEIRIVDQGVGMTLDDIVRYLLTPHRSKNRMIIDQSQAAQGVTGRFGHGFFSNISLLTKDGDSIVIKTRSGNDQCIELKIYFLEGEYWLDLSEAECEPGTEVRVLSSLLAKTATQDPLTDILDKSVKAKFQFNKKYKVSVNAVLANPHSIHNSIDIDGTKITTFDEPASEEGAGTVFIVVNGVVIQEKKIKGINIFTKMVIEMPEDTPLTSDRSTIDLKSQVAQKNFIKIIDRVIMLDEHQHKEKVFNSLYNYLKDSSQEDFSFIDDWVPKKKLVGILPAIGSFQYIQAVGDASVTSEKLIHPDVFGTVADVDDLTKRFGKEKNFLLPVKLQAGHTLTHPIETHVVNMFTFSLVPASTTVRDPLLRQVLSEQGKDIALLNSKIDNNWHTETVPCYEEERGRDRSIQEISFACFERFIRESERASADYDSFSNDPGYQHNVRIVIDRFNQFLNAFDHEDIDKKEVHEFASDVFVPNMTPEYIIINFNVIRAFLKKHKVSFKVFFDVYKRFKELGINLSNNRGMAEHIALVLMSENFLEKKKHYPSSELFKYIGGKNKRSLPEYFFKERISYYEDSFVEAFNENPKIAKNNVALGFENIVCRINVNPKDSKEYYKKCIEMMKVLFYECQKDYFLMEKINIELMTLRKIPSSEGSAAEKIETMLRYIVKDGGLIPYLKALLDSINGETTLAKKIDFPVFYSMQPIEENAKVIEAMGRDKELINKEYKVACRQNPDPRAFVHELLKNSKEAYATEIDIDFGEDSSGDLVMRVKDNGKGVSTMKQSSLYVPQLNDKIPGDGDMNFGWGFFTLFQQFDEIVIESKSSDSEMIRIFLKKTKSGIDIHTETVQGNYPHGTTITAKTIKKYNYLDAEKIKQEFLSKSKVFKGRMVIDGKDFSIQDNSILDARTIYLKDHEEEKANFHLLENQGNQVVYNGNPLPDGIMHYFDELVDLDEIDAFSNMLGPVSVEIKDANFSQNSGRTGFIYAQEVKDLLRKTIRSAVLAHLRRRFETIDSWDISVPDVLSAFGHDFFYKKKFEISRNSANDLSDNKLVSIFKKDHKKELIQQKIGTPIRGLAGNTYLDIINLLKENKDIDIHGVFTKFFDRGPSGADNFMSNSFFHIAVPFAEEVRNYEKKEAHARDIQKKLIISKKEFHETSKTYFGNDLSELDKQFRSTHGNIAHCALQLRIFLDLLAKKIGVNDISIGFFGTSPSTIASASQGIRSININVLSELFHYYCYSYNNGIIPSSIKAQWINTMTHELVHTEEEPGEITHTSVFFDRQREYILGLFK